MGKGKRKGQKGKRRNKVSNKTEGGYEGPDDGDDRGRVLSGKEKRELKKRQQRDAKNQDEEKNVLTPMFEKGNVGWPEYVWLKGTAYSQGKRNMNMDIIVENFDLHIGKGQQLLNSAELRIHYGNRYSIVGRNGIGKSVLMRAISSRSPPFDVIPKWYSILHVEQEIVGDERSPLEIVLSADKERLWLVGEAARLEKEEAEKEKAREENPEADEESEESEDDLNSYNLADIYERMREIDAHKAESRASSILAGLQFGKEEMRSKPSKEYSGGWRMRISLARALFIVPELLILDEPSNHLDLHAAIWLEQYLMRYKKTLLLVSHDESILNSCSTHVLHFFNQKLDSYNGNYTQFLEIRQQRITALTKQLKALKTKLKKARGAAQKNKGTKKGAQLTSEVNSLEEQVEEAEKRLVLDERAPSFSFPEVGRKEETAIIKMNDCSFGYTKDHTIFHDLNFGIYMDSRVALVGANGVGKSTLMKLFSGELEPSEGTVEKSRKLRSVKFDQHAEDAMVMSETPIDMLQRVGDFNGVGPVRGHLGRFGIKGGVATQKLGSLSGGQKSRVVFSVLAAKGPHLMLLDEPTNHLDIFAIKALGEGLQGYEGGLVVISHNQSILEMCCDMVWIVNQDGTITEFNGSFADYKEEIVEHMMAEYDDSSE